MQGKYNLYLNEETVQLNHINLQYDPKCERQKMAIFHLFSFIFCFLQNHDGWIF